MTMEPDELNAFLDRESPALLAYVGSTFEDGSPHIAPVWYRWDGREVTIWTGAKRPWARNLARDPRASFVVAEAEPPFAGVVMTGRVTIRTADDEVVTAEIRRITRRYIPEDEVEAYVRGWPNLRTIVTLRPESVRSWGRGY
jgi:PPOX class probable F420-dependent enzyme